MHFVYDGNNNITPHATNLYSNSANKCTKQIYKKNDTFGANIVSSKSLTKSVLPTKRDNYSHELICMDRNINQSSNITTDKKWTDWITAVQTYGLSHINQNSCWLNHRIIVLKWRFVLILLLLLSLCFFSLSLSLPVCLFKYILAHLQRPLLIIRFVSAMLWHRSETESHRRTETKKKLFVCSLLYEFEMFVFFFALLESLTRCSVFISSNFIRRWYSLLLGHFFPLTYSTVKEIR